MKSLFAIMLGLPASFSCCGDALEHKNKLPPTSEKIIDAAKEADVTPVAKHQEAAVHDADPSMLDSPSKLLGPMRLPTPDWLTAAQATAIGDRFTPPEANEVAHLSLRALGFRPLPNDGQWLREADLMQLQPLTPSDMPDYPLIDAVAVISVYRPHLQEQYIYPTLRSLFAALPPLAIVNVLVGDANVDYVSTDVLEQELGAQNAARVRVIAPPKTTSDFFESTHASVAAKATWNYARALRSYSGTKSLLLCEDDIDISKLAFHHLEPHLQNDMTGIYILYNQRCAYGKPMWTAQGSTLTLHAFTVRSNSNFPTTQAIIYSASLAHPIGDYLIARAGREPYDYLTSRYLADYRYTVGFVYPSVVQHTGLKTTGLSAEGRPPLTSCYHADLPEPP